MLKICQPLHIDARIMLFFSYICRIGSDVPEARTFLETGPESVKLTPSWEDRNLPSSELNFKGVESDVDKAVLDMDPPPDRYQPASPMHNSIRSFISFSFIEKNSFKRSFSSFDFFF